MRDPTHLESVERWAKYVKTHPDWKKLHTKFINAQLEKANAVIKKLAKTKEGREKIAKLYGIRNRNGYPEIFGNT